MPDVHFSNQYPYTDFHELNLDWVIETVKHWADLVGKTIQSITLTGTTGLVDTYTINYSDGTTSTFTVTNGRGITSITLTGSLGLVDTYTITYNDGSTSTFQINNGNGISSIEKTGTSGLIDTYTITYTDGSSTTFEVKNGAEALDATLTLAGYAADAKATGDALALKQNAADPAGLAENLTPYSPDSGATQSVPFINQGTGCGNGESIVDTGSYAQIKKKLGNTVCVNQLLPAFASGNGWQAYRGTVAFADGVATFTVTNSGSSKQVYSQRIACPAGRVARSAVYVKPSKAITARISMGAGNVGNLIACPANVWTAVYFSGALTNAVSEWSCYVDGNSELEVNDTVQLKEAVFSDLAIWYGSTDRIPSDLLSHPENWGRYYSGSLAYNAGTLDSADGTVMRSIGRNLFDKSQNMTNNKYLTDTGADNTNSVWSYSDYIAIIPNTEYFATVTGSNPSTCFYDANKNFVSGIKHSEIVNQHFTTPPNAFYLRISMQTSLIDSFDLSLYYPGESGYDQYYPYTVLAEVDTGSEVLRSAGAVADEKTPDGTITRKVGIVDLGTLAWTYENGVFYSTGTSAIAKPQQYPTCARYAAIDDGSDKSIYIGNSGITYAYDSSYTNAAAFQAAMNGVEMTYELLTPTTEQGTPFSGASADNFAIDDFGSMYWTQSAGVPQGVEIFYPYDYKAAVDSLLNMVSGDVDNLATDAELATVAGRVPNAPTTNGTYILKATVTGGIPTYSWVAE